MIQEHSQFKLLLQRRFAPFFWTQFCGAANDNIYKFACTLLVTYQAASYSSLPSTVLVNLIAGLFILPFLLFSASSGQLADKLERSRLIRFTKILELGIVLLAIFGFSQQNIVILLSCIFLLGLQATIFGPVKYAYLPQHLLAHEIVGGNALVEGGTFVAILLGTLIGNVLVIQDMVATTWVAYTILTVALLGLVTSYWIPYSPAPDTQLPFNWNPFTEILNNLKLARERRVVFLSMLGISWLWFFGATLLTQLPIFAKEVVNGGPHIVMLFITLFTLGISIGSLLCERLSGHKVEIGLVPFGSIGMSLFAIDLYFSSHAATVPYAAEKWVDITQFISAGKNWRLMGDLFLLSLFGGLYSVPLYALIQTRSPIEKRARMIAANNILNAFFMIVAAGVAAFCLTLLHFTIPELFLLMAFLNALVAIYIFGLVPEFLLRFLAWILVHSIYRLKKEGTSHIPERGAAVLVCNHVSFVDAVILMGISPRPIRFVMDYQMFKFPVISWFSRQAKVIPIASARVDMVMMERAFAEVSQALNEGDLVCIFPEGRITDDGKINRFRPGISRILQLNPVPVIPLALCGLWGSFFSRRYGSAMTRLRGFHSRIKVRVGSAVPAQQATPEHLQQRVEQLRGDEW